MRHWKVSKYQAITATQMGKPVTCSSEQYQQTVKAAIVSQRQKWIQEKNVALASRAVAEISRLDKLYGIAK